MTERPVKLAGKAVIWQAIQMGGVKVIFLVRILVLARLLSPADFGLIAIATTAMGFLLNVTNFGMIPALVQGKETDDAQYNAAWTIGITRSAIIALMMIVAAPIIATIFAEPQAVVFIRILALNPLLEALTSIKVAALNKNLLFRPLAMLRLADALVNAIVSITLAMVYGVWGLVAGMLAGAATMVIGSYLLAPHRPRLSFSQEAIRPLIHFGRWIFITSLITMAGSYALRIVISRQLGAAGLGLYYLATQLAFMPGEVASEVVGSVAFPLFARLQNDVAQATRAFRAIYTSLAALLYPACALIIVLAPGLAQDVLGPSWAGTEPVIQVLAFVNMIGIFGEASSPVLKGFGQPYRITMIEFIQSSIIIFLVWILTEQFGLVGAALAWLPAISLSQFFSAHFMRQLLDHPFTGLHRPVLAALGITGICTALAAAVHSVIPGLAGIAAAGALAVLAAGALLLVSDRYFSLGFVQNLTLAFPQVAAWIGVPAADNLS